ncbi:MAG: ATP-binding protein [Pseudomonadota bacterium]|jgi:hypothetical protein|nr:ATP-binding protein [Pseudomonadota bacterium]
MGVDGCVRVVYTCQQEGLWKYCIGQCVLGQAAGGDLREVYSTFTFISSPLRAITLRKLVEASAGDTGLTVAPDRPPLRLTAPTPNWREEIVPSHATASGIPARRFTISVEPNAVFANDQLFAYDEPYRPSAERYVKSFLGLKPQDSVDGRRGEFAIEVPDRRGAIQLRSGRLCLATSSMPLRLVGEIDGKMVDLRNSDSLEIDDRHIRSVELWLLASGSDLVDYISTTRWPYKYAITPEEAKEEQRLLELVRGGESETCEFKPHIDLGNPKAAELEKTVCAFSNQRGGTLFIGVDDEGSILGIANEVTKRPDHLEKALADYGKAVRKRLRDRLKDNQCFNIRAAILSGMRVIVVEVGRAREVNYVVADALANTAFIRHGATSCKMLPSEIRAQAADDAQFIINNQVFGS